MTYSAAQRNLKARGNSQVQKKPENQFDIGSAIRGRRLQLNYTLKHVSERAGLSVGFLSQVERNITVPSLSSLVSISGVLEVGVEYFLSTPEGAGRVTRNDSREFFSVSDSQVKYARLTNEFPGSQLTGVITRMPSGFQSEEVSHQGEEIVYILSGSMFIRVGEEEYIISSGDSLHFKSNVPHQWGNRSEEECVALFVNSPSLFGASNMQHT
jgi:quercetin dioxygenase-like cupin family protein